MCESASGYVSNFIIYTGKSTTYLEKYEKYGTGIKAVLTLMDGFLEKGYCITGDNFYLSPDLEDILINQKTDIYGTIRVTRKDVPEELKNKTTEKGGKW